MTSSSSSRISAVRPLWAVEGGRVTIAGTGLPVDPVLPEVTIGGVPARLACASSTALTAIVPAGLEGGHTADPDRRARGRDRLRGGRGAARHRPSPGRQPAFDAAGNLYVTFSGSRGQQAPVAIYVVRPDGSREPFVADLPNPTSLAFEPRRPSARLEPVRRQRPPGRRGRQRVRPSPPTSASPAALRSPRMATCSSAIDPARSCAFATGARRSSRAFRPASPRSTWRSGRTASSTSRRRRWRRATACTACRRRVTWKSSMTASAGRRASRSMRTATSTSWTRSRDSAASTVSGWIDHEAEQVVSGGSLIGLAFDPRGGLVLASSDTVYRFARTPTARRPA